jgi:tRNA pseudouridine38-40 synthase
MAQWKILLSYDGTSYRGWQVQPNLPTIQGTLAQAIHRITGEIVLPQGSGRTDTGVHALAQVASFALEAPIPAANLHRALNRALPSSIRVLSAEIVSPQFHARHSAVCKTYEYRIFPGDRICSPMLAPYVWPCHVALDLPALHQAATYILGTHDFTSFAAADPDLTTRRAESPPARDYLRSESVVADQKSTAPTPATRTIFESQWLQRDELLVYHVTGSGFLHHMVRNLVGTFFEVGVHRISPDAIPTVLAARDRSAAGPTAPASGLFLIHVEYA